MSPKEDKTKPNPDYVPVKEDPETIIGYRLLEDGSVKPYRLKEMQAGGPIISRYGPCWFGPPPPAA